MKKLLSTVTAVAFATMLVTPTFAHTHLTETNPADGATVTEAPSELFLQFDGQVGEGSFVELTNSAGEEVTVPNIAIGDKNMTATLAEPLTNDNYTVAWSIISADGHPLQGSYTFTINAPVVETPAEEPVVEEVETTVATETEPVQEESSSNNTILIIAGVLAVVIIGSMFALLKRKK